MRKNFWLIVKEISNRIGKSPSQFVVTVLGLCVSAITSIVVLQYILGIGWQLTDSGGLVKSENFVPSEMALYLAMGAALIVFALVNLVMLFRHLSQVRRKTYQTYKMFGCPAGMIFCLSFSELLFYILIGGVLAAAVYAPIAEWMERMYYTVYPQAYWGLAVYAGAVLILAAASSLAAAGIRLNHREG